MSIQLEKVNVDLNAEALDLMFHLSIPILPGYVLHVRTGSINDIPTNLCLSTHCNTTQRKQTDAILSFNELNIIWFKIESILNSRKIGDIILAAQSHVEG